MKVRKLLKIEFLISSQAPKLSIQPCSQTNVNEYVERDRDRDKDREVEKKISGSVSK